MSTNPRTALALGRCLWRYLMCCCLMLHLGLGAGLARASTQGQAETPEAFIEKLTTQLLDLVKADAQLRSGNLNKITAVVNEKLLPHVNFERMTASAVGPAWRSANTAQRHQLTEAFKLLLVRTYAGALAQIKDQKVVVKKSRAAPTDTEVVIRTELVGSGEPVPIDYRLEKTPEGPVGWRIFNFNVLGVWLVETYRSQFSQVVNANGIDGLITSLNSLNKGGRP